MKSLVDGGEGERNALSAAIAVMVMRARAQQSVDFPNPGRVGCSDPETLRARIASGALPGDELRAHLFNCSECFLSYRAELAAHRIRADVLLTPWWKRALGQLLSPTGYWVSASALSLLLLLILAGAHHLHTSAPFPGTVAGADFHTPPASDSCKGG